MPDVILELPPQILTRHGLWPSAVPVVYAKHPPTNIHTNLAQEYYRNRKDNFGVLWSDQGAQAVYRINDDASGVFEGDWRVVASGFFELIGIWMSQDSGDGELITVGSPAGPESV